MDLQLLNNGQPVAWYADSDDSGLYFYGEGIDSTYVVANIYQLKKGRRYELGEAAVTGASATEMSAGFVVQRHVEEDRIDLPWLYNDSEADLWIWADLSGNELRWGIGPEGFDVPTPGALSGQTARLTVNMEAWVNSSNVGYQYEVEVAVNGTDVGTLNFMGGVLLQESVEFSSDYLNNGANRVTLTAAALGAGILVDSFDVKYVQAYAALEDQLIFTVGESAVTVSGFSETPQLFEILDGSGARPVTGAVVEEGRPEVSAEFYSDRPGQPLSGPGPECF